MVRKILSHLTIIFGGMCFVLFVIDCIKGGAMSFLNNGITKSFVCILSLLSITGSVISLTAQTREQKLYDALQKYRRKSPQASESSYASGSRSSYASSYSASSRSAAPRSAAPRSAYASGTHTSSRSAYGAAPRRSTSAYSASASRSPYAGRR